jgi:iron only hydrogenase large subunit-like protein
MPLSIRPVIEVDQENCVNCHRCIAVCPVKMCNNGSGDHVRINGELCLGCGECIDACTHGARRGIDDAEAFFSALARGDRVVAILAPAVAASFDGQYLRLNGWLSSLGAAACFDVSFGAELTVKSYLEHKKGRPGCMIAQPCPSLVSFIEMYRPELIPLLAPADSPMVHTMKMVRRFYRQYSGCKFAVISPCYSKRREFDDVGIGDYNVTFRSVEEHLRKNGIRLSSFPERDYDNPPAERASLFSIPGGLMRTVERHAPGISEAIRKIEGQPEIYHYLAHLGEAIKNGEAPIHEIIDCLNCDMGCNGGAGTSNRGKPLDAVEGAVERRNEKLRLRYARRGRFGKAKGSIKELQGYINRYWEPGLYRRSYTDKSAIFKKCIRKPSSGEIEERYKLMHKAGERDILNCGSCGYKSCEQMAVAIINGLNRNENCRHYMSVEVSRMHDKHKEDMACVIDSVASASAERLRRSMEDMHSLAEVSEEMAACVTQSSASIEEMVASIQSITRVLGKNTRGVLELQDASVQGKAGIDAIANLIAEISEESLGLAETSSVIKKIASQTNLLAMNAAIEAAHAGSYGEGFAVVAGEIRSLAENAGTQASSISQVLKHIKGLIDKAVGSSSSSSDRFEQVVDLAARVKDQEMLIQNAVDEQGVGGKQVLEALTRMNQITSRVRDDAKGLLSASGEILKELERLSKMEGASARA